MDDIFVLPYSLYDLSFFRMYGDFSNAFAVHINSDEEMIKKIMAGMKSYTLGLKSIDYVYKNYSERWDFETEDNDYLRKCYGILSPHMETLSALIASLNKWEGNINIGRFGVVAGVSRIEKTFESIHFLIIRGYHIQFDFAKEIDQTEEYIRHIEESFRTNDGKDT